MPRLDLEFYETPAPFVRYLLGAGEHKLWGRVLEPCAGHGAIPRACPDQSLEWITNDLDPTCPSTFHEDATSQRFWDRWTGLNRVDHVISNTPFTPAIEIIDHALRAAKESVAMYLRVSIHEILKEGPRRRWFYDHPPTEIHFLPRWAYQRSGKTGKWTTDSATANWVIWNVGNPHAPQKIKYMPEEWLDSLDRETPMYRARMDALMGFTGTEAERQRQRIDLGKGVAA